MCYFGVLFFEASLGQLVCWAKPCGVLIVIDDSEFEELKKSRKLRFGYLVSLIVLRLTTVKAIAMIDIRAMYGVRDFAVERVSLKML